MRGEVLIAPKLKQAFVARSSLAPVQEWRKWPRLGYALPPLLRRRARRWSKLVTVVFLSGRRSTGETISVERSPSFIY
jgi:hypothetical protein